MNLIYELIPNNYSNNNIYRLNLKFINDEDTQYWIEEVKLICYEQNIFFKKPIKKGLYEPWFYGFMKSKIVESFDLKINRDIVAPRKFIVRLYFREIINQKRTQLYYFEWGPLFFQIKPSPTHKAFISRSVRDEESYIPDVISELIKDWGFDVYTVGIPPLKKQYEDEELLRTITNQIAKADVVFAIATKRDQMMQNLNWRTFEWLQSETSMAYVLKKLIIVLVEEGVDLSGLASHREYLRFRADELNSVNSFFDLYMPRIRELVQYNKNTKDLNDFLKRCVYLGGLVLIGAVAYIAGKEDQDYQNE